MTGRLLLACISMCACHERHPHAPADAASPATPPAPTTAVSTDAGNDPYSCALRARSEELGDGVAGVIDDSSATERRSFGRDQLARSSDGMTLWLRRRFDGPGQEVIELSVTCARSPPGKLEFVDAMIERVDPPEAGHVRQIYPESDRSVELLLAGWFFDRARHVAISPKTKQEFALIQVGSPTVDLTWNVYLETCAEKGQYSGCVLTGEPRAVCAELRHRVPVGRRHVWIAPSGCELLH